MLWLNCLNHNGYGQFWLPSPRGMHLAHRVSYQLAYGPIPEGLTIDHVKVKGCTNRHCVAPYHLEAVTGAENTRRGDSASGRNARKRFCSVGHLLAGPNLYIHPGGSRRCRTCSNQAPGPCIRFEVKEDA